MPKPGDKMNNKNVLLNHSNVLSYRHIGEKGGEDSLLEMTWVIIKVIQELNTLSFFSHLHSLNFCQRKYQKNQLVDPEIN